MSRVMGYDRGLPIDRIYIERFLDANAEVIRGRALEVGDSSYTRRFGGRRVHRCDVLNVDSGQPGTTIVANLSDAPQVPSATFDVVVLTQTLQYVYDLRAATETLHRILRSGGTVLATFPGVSAISRDSWTDSWYWSLTVPSAVRLFGDAFGPDNVEVTGRGNVLTSVAFLQGLASDEIRPDAFDVDDPQYPIVITVKARRASDEPASG